MADSINNPVIGQDQNSHDKLHCSFCEKGFRHQPSLNSRHIRRAHLPNTPWHCSICYKTSTCKQGVFRHAAASHPLQFQHVQAIRSTQPLTQETHTPQGHQQYYTDKELTSHTDSGLRLPDTISPPSASSCSAINTPHGKLPQHGNDDCGIPDAHLNHDRINLQNLPYRGLQPMRGSSQGGDDRHSEHSNISPHVTRSCFYDQSL